MAVCQQRYTSVTFESGLARCSVRVFERYSYAGGNRVSLILHFFKMTKIQFKFPITAGGSQAVFFKINTWGEAGISR